MVSAVNPPGTGGGQGSPKRRAETHTRGRLNAYRWPRMVGRDLRTRRSAQRLPHSADKDEAGGSSPPRPTNHSRRSARCRPQAGRTHCLPGPRRGRTPSAQSRSRPFRSRPPGAPSHGRPRAGDHVPDDLRAAMPQMGEPRRGPGSRPTSGPCATGSSWSARQSSLAAGRGPPYDHGHADASVGPARPAPASSVRLRLGQTASRSWIPSGATTPTPAVLAVWLLAASARLTTSPGSDTADAGTPG